MKATNKSLLAMAFLGATFMACNNQEESTEVETVPAVEETAFLNEEGVLQLNGSEKWPANAETTEGVQNMVEQIQGFRGLNVQDDLASYNLLARGIKNTMDEIFKKCTMKGAAHDELHDFLLPILGMQKKLAGDDLDRAKETLDKLEDHLNLYSEFFE